MSKKMSKREAKRSREDGPRPRPIPKPKAKTAPAQAFVLPPLPPQPKTYKELIERHKLIVEHADMGGVRRVTVRKGHRAVSAIVSPGAMSPASWGTAGRKMHLLIKSRLELDWERAKEVLEGMLGGTVGMEQTMALYQAKTEEQEQEKEMVPPEPVGALEIDFGKATETAVSIGATS